MMTVDTYQFDFNGTTSYTQSGYTAVAYNKLYGSATDPEYGWTANVGAFDRSGVTAPTNAYLLRDGVYYTNNGSNDNGARTFKVDLPAGTYFVSLTAGDGTTGHAGLQVKANGNVAVPDVDNTGGWFSRASFTVSVSESVPLSMEFRDMEAGNNDWVLNSLEIRPAEDVLDTLTITGPAGSVEADGLTIDTFSGSGATADAYLTVTTTKGTLTSTDLGANTSLPYHGLQIKADSAGNFTFTLQRPTGIASGTLVVEELTGAKQGTATTSYVTASIRRFDLTSSLSSVEAGYIGVLATDTYNATLGYGWQSTVGHITRSGSAPLLLRSINYFADSATFVADVPNGTYYVTVTLGDVITARTRHDVYAEGTQVLDEVSSAVGNLTSRTFSTTVSDGNLTLGFIKDGGGDFSIGSIEIRPSQASDITVSGPTGNLAADGLSTDTFTVTAPVNSLVTLSSTMGAISGVADAAPYYSGVQILGNGGPISFGVSRPIYPGNATISAEEVTGARVGSMIKGYVLSDTRLFDFDDLTPQGGTSPTASGYLQVLPSTLATSILGFGWDTTISSYDRNSSYGVMFRDSNYSASAHTFSVKLPNGTYIVNVTLGDPSLTINQIQVNAEGGAAELSDLQTSSPSYLNRRGFTVAVADGELNLEIDDLGTLGDFWAMNAMEIHPYTPSAVMTFDAPNGPLASDSTTLETITGHNASPNSLVTVTTNMGNITSTDGNATFYGTQVQADSNGNFTVIIQRSLTAGNGTLTAVDYLGEHFGEVVIPYSPLDTRRFDFNNSNTQTASGYIGVLPTDLYSSGGWGWGNGTLGSISRSLSNDLLRDFIYATRAGGNDTAARTFSVDVPNGAYYVTMSFGDNIVVRDQIQVNAEGGAAELTGVSNTATGRFVHRTFSVSVSDGKLDVELSDLGGSDSSWVVNSLEFRLSQGNLSLSGPAGTLSPDGTTVDTFTGQGATPSKLITITTTLGNVTPADGSDASTSYLGTQVTADGNGGFTFTIRRPSGVGVATITAEETSGATIGNYSQTYGYTLSIGNASVIEGNSGTQNAVFTVTLSGNVSQTVTVQYTTGNGTAIAGSDFAATSGTLTFSPGQTSKTVTVGVLGETLDEADTESFIVTLSNAGNAVIAQAVGTGSIIDDDAGPTVSLGNLTLTEGNTGVSNAIFTIALSAVSGRTITVPLSTSDGSAMASSDYVAQAGTVTFGPGNTSQTVTVAVNGDTFYEANENFSLTLGTPVNASLGQSVGVATINNDDVPPSITLDAPGTASEGANLTISGTANQFHDANFTYAWSVARGNTSIASGNSSTIHFVPSDNGNYTVALTLSNGLGESATQSANITVSNVAPTANPGGPYTLAEGASTSLAGSFTDPGVDDTQVLAWDLDGDGIFGETSGGALRGIETGATPTFNAAGVSGLATRTVTLRVTDDDGGSHSSTAFVAITNVPPSANAGGPYDVSEGATVELSGTGADPVDTVTFEWDLDGDGAFGETGAGASYGDEIGATPVFHGIDPELRTVTLRVLDSEGASAINTTTVEIHNAAPTANAGGPYDVSEGGTVALIGTGSDLSGTVTLSWDLDGDGEFGNITSVRGNEALASPIWNAASINGPTTRVVTLLVTDADGATTTSTAQISIANVAPSANAGGPYNVNEGNTVALSGAGSDPVDSLTFNWDLDGDGTFGETGAGALRGIETGASPVFNAAGVSGNATVIVELRVNDSDGAITPSTTEIKVINVAPTANPGGGYTVDEGGTVGLSGTGTDPVDSVFVDWDLDGDGLFGEVDSAYGNESLANPIFNAASFNNPASPTVTVRVTDANGAVDTSTTAITVRNTPPQANAGGAYTVAENGTVGITGLGADVKDEVLLSWDLDGDGTFGETGSAAGRGAEVGNSTIFNAAGLNGPGFRTVTLLVSETSDDGSATSTALIDIRNVAPSASTTGPYSVDEGATVLLSGSATDPIDTPSLLWDLDNDGTFGETGGSASYGNETGSTPTFSAAGLSGTVTQTIWVQASDGQGGSFVQSTTVTISNVQPTTNAGGPYFANEGSSTGLSGTGCDPVDAISFSWDLDGDGTFGETGVSASRGDETGLTPTFNAAQVNGPALVTVALRATDADGAFSESIAAVNVVNVAPHVPTSSTYTVLEGSSVGLYVGATDYPGDTVTVLWDLDGDGSFGETGAGASRGNETGSSPVFSAAGLDDSTITVTVRATDNDGMSATAFPQIEIVNVAPTANPGGPYTVNEGATTGLSGSGTDPGPDTLTYLWDLDGDGVFGETGSAASYGHETGANPVFNAATLNGPAVRTISLRTADGDGGFGNATVALTIANVAPTANAGAGYTVVEGSTTSLSGTASDPSDSLTVSWDLDGDGSFGETGATARRGNETGLTPVFNAVGLIAPLSHTVTLRVSDGTAVTYSTTTLTLTESPTVQLSIANGNVTEGNSGNTSLVLNVSTSQTSSRTIFADYRTGNATSGNQATAGSDYHAASGTISLAPGATSTSVTISVIGDTAVELNEVFQVGLDNLRVIGPTPSFGNATKFSQLGVAGLAAADINQDGLIDLVTTTYSPTGGLQIRLNQSELGADTPTFAAPQSISTPGWASSVVAGDLNGDGLPDLVVTHLGNIYTHALENYITIYFNTTTPGNQTISFAAPMQLATGNGPFTAALGQINDDDQLDIVVANAGANSISVLINQAPATGNSAFSAPATFTTGNFPAGLAIGDLNNDGLDDIAVVNSGWGDGPADNELTLLMNTTTGNTPAFNTESWEIGNRPVSVTITDFNADGLPDVAAVNSDSNSISLFTNTHVGVGGNLSLSAQTTLATPASGPQSMAVGDWNDDGAPDLAVLHYGTGSSAGNRALLFTNRSASGGALTFTHAGNVTLHSRPLLIAAADITRDGRPDLIATAGNLTVAGNIAIAVNTTAPEPPIAIGNSGVATIIDDELPFVSIATANSTVSETSSPVVVTLQLSRNATTDVVVPLSISGNTTDVTVSPSTVTILTGSSTATFTVTLTNDTLDEPNEFVFISLGNASGATVADNSSYSITVLDDDDAPTVSLGSAAYTGNATGAFTANLTLSTPSGFPVSVPYQLIDTTTGAQYAASPNPLVIPIGSTSASFLLSPTLNGTATPGATLMLTLGVPTNATLGATTLSTASPSSNQSSSLFKISAGKNLTLDEGAFVTLDGDHEAPGSGYTYLWKKVSGIQTIPDDRDSTMQFTALDNGDYVFALTVADQFNAQSATATVAVHVNNVAPVVIEKSYTVNEGGTVNLEGAFNDPGNDTYTYKWDLITAPSKQTLPVTTTKAFSFVPQNKGDYTLRFTVTDDDGAVGAGNYTVIALNVPPTAPQASIDPPTWSTNLKAGADVILTAGPTNPIDADPLTYKWRLTSAPAGTTIPDHEGQQYSFVLPKYGEYSFDLTATDDEGSSATTTYTFKTPEGNHAPFADIIDGPVTLAEDGNISLFGAFTDPDFDDTHTFAWKVYEIESYNPYITGQYKAEIASGSKQSLDFEAPTNGFYYAEFTVTDNEGKSSSDSVVLAHPALPTIHNLTSTTITEGGITYLTGDIDHPGNQRLSLAVNWSEPDENPTSTITLQPGATSFKIAHQYPDDASSIGSESFTAQISIENQFGVSTYTHPISVANAAPILSDVKFEWSGLGRIQATGHLTDSGTDTILLKLSVGNVSISDNEIGTLTYEQGSVSPNGNFSAYFGVGWKTLRLGEQVILDIAETMKLAGFHSFPLTLSADDGDEGVTSFSSDLSIDYGGPGAGGASTATISSYSLTPDKMSEGAIVELRATVDSTYKGFAWISWRDSNAGPEAYYVDTTYSNQIVAQHVYSRDDVVVNNEGRSVSEYPIVIDLYNNYYTSVNDAVIDRTIAHTAPTLGKIASGLIGMDGRVILTGSLVPQSPLSGPHNYSLNVDYGATTTDSYQSYSSPFSVDRLTLQTKYPEDKVNASAPLDLAYDVQVTLTDKVTSQQQTTTTTAYRGNLELFAPDGTPVADNLEFGNRIAFPAAEDSWVPITVHKLAPLDLGPGRFHIESLGAVYRDVDGRRIPLNWYSDFDPTVDETIYVPADKGGDATINLYWNQTLLDQVYFQVIDVQLSGEGLVINYGDISQAEKTAFGSATTELSHLMLSGMSGSGNFTLDFPDDKIAIWKSINRLTSDRILPGEKYNPSTIGGQLFVEGLLASEAVGDISIDIDWKPDRFPSAGPFKDSITWTVAEADLSIVKCDDAVVADNQEYSVGGYQGGGNQSKEEHPTQLVISSIRPAALGGLFSLKKGPSQEFSWPAGASRVIDYTADGPLAAPADSITREFQLRWRPDESSTPHLMDAVKITSVYPEVSTSGPAPMNEEGQKSYSTLTLRNDIPGDFQITVPANFRIWRNSDLTSEVVTGTTLSLSSSSKTYYVEAIPATSDWDKTLELKYVQSDLLDCDEFVTRFDLTAQQTLISVFATDAYAAETGKSEPEDTAQFTFSRGEGHTRGDVIINYVIESSSALNLVDASSSDHKLAASGSVTIPDGKSSVTLTVTPVDDTDEEWDETLKIRLSSVNFKTTYSVGSGNASITILDNDYAGLLNRNIDTASTGLSVDSVSNGVVAADLQQGGVRLVLDVSPSSFAPTYRTDDNLRPIVTVDMKIPTERLELTQLTKLTADLDFGKNITATTSLSPTDLVGDDRLFHFAVIGDATNLRTGHYDYSITFKGYATGNRTFTRTIHGGTEIVNLTAALAKPFTEQYVGSPEFGDRFWVDELDRIVPYDGMASSLAEAGLATQSGVALMRGDNTSAFFPADISKGCHTIIDQFDVGSSKAWISGTFAGGHGSDGYKMFSSGAGAGDYVPATWTATVEPQRMYQVFVTWVPGPDRSQVAEYSVTGGDRVGSRASLFDRQETNLEVNQRYTPGEVEYADTRWRSLGFYRATDNQLQVALNPDWNSVADAIMIVEDWDYTAPDGTFDTLEYGKLSDKTKIDGYEPEDDDWTLLDKFGGRSQFDALGLLQNRVDRNGNRIEFKYTDRDSDGIQDELKSITTQGNLTTRYDYTGASYKVVDFAERATEYTVTSGRVAKITQPDPGFDQKQPSIELKYTDGLLGNVTDARGNSTFVRYSTAGTPNVATNRVSAIISPDGAKHQITPYVVEGLDTQVHFAPTGNIGKTDTSTFTERREVRAKYTDPYLNEWTYQTDRFGLTTALADPKPFGNVTKWLRNEDGLPTKLIEPAGSGGTNNLPELITLYTYDDRGNGNLTIYPDGNRAISTYDEKFNQLIKFELPMLARTVEYELDSRGNYETMKETGRATNDNAVPADGAKITRTTRYEYTPAPTDIKGLPGGLPTLTTVAADTEDESASFISYYETGTAIGLPEWVSSAYGTIDADFESFEYDKNRNPREHYDFEQDNITFTYDNLNRLLQLLEPSPRTTDHGRPETVYTYDTMGNRLSEKNFRGNTTFEYDKLQRLTDIYAPPTADVKNPRPTHYDYYLTGDVRFTRAPNDAPTVYLYDARGNLLTATGPTPDTKQHKALTTKYTYDSAGQIATKTITRTYIPNPNEPEDVEATDLVWSYTYDNRHRLGNETLPAAEVDGKLTRTTSYRSYYADGQLYTLNTPNAENTGNLTTTYTYDGFGRQKTVILPDPDRGAATLFTPVTFYEYYLDDTIKTVTDASGSTSFEYDHLNRLTKTYLPDPDGPLGVQSRPVTEVDYQINSAGQRVELYKDARGAITTKIYDGLDRLVEMIEPDPDQEPDGSKNGELKSPDTRLTYYPDGLLKSTTSVLADGNRNVNYVYDAQSMLKSLTDASGSIEFTYDASGNKRTIKDQSGNITTYDYDLLNRLTKVTSAKPTGLNPQIVTSFTYDSLGNQRSQTEMGNRVTQNQYDGLNRLTITTLPRDTTSSVSSSTNGERNVVRTYYADGLLKTIAAAGQPATLYTYDDLGRTTSVADPSGNATTTHYDNEGHVESIEDPTHNLTRYQFDHLGRKIAEIIKLRNETGALQDYSRSWEYDSNGNAIKYQDRNGRETEYSYDYLNRPSSETWIGDPNGYKASFVYNELGEMTHASNSFSAIDIDYDNLGRTELIEQTIADLPSISQTTKFDSVGNLRQSSLYIGTKIDSTTTYTPDVLRRVTNIARSGGNATPISVRMEYTLEGFLKATHRSVEGETKDQRGVEALYDYWSDGALRSLDYDAEFFGANIARYEFNYDAAGRIQRIEETAYDAAGKENIGISEYKYDLLSQLTDTMDTSQVGESNDYAYDANRNSTIGTTIGPDNRLLEDRLYSYVYDKEGNRIERLSRDFVVIIDNRDPFPDFEAAKTSGGKYAWQTEPGGLGGDQAVHNGNDPGSQAAWSFYNLEPGEYEIAITWDPISDAATDIECYWTTGAESDYVDLDQTQMPNPMGKDGDERWKILATNVTIAPLGDFGIGLPSLIVDIHTPDDGEYHGFVIADAVRVRRLDGAAPASPKVQWFDNNTSARPNYTFESTGGSWKTESVGNPTPEDTQLIGDLGSTDVGTATWRFANLEPGEYLVSSSWKSASTTLYSMRYSIFDGPYQAGSARIIDSAPDYYDKVTNRSWTDLGTVTVGSGVLRVQLVDLGDNDPLNNNNKMRSIADAIRIERVSDVVPRTTYTVDYHNQITEVGTYDSKVAPQPSSSVKYEYDVLGRQIGRTETQYKTEDHSITKQVIEHYIYDGNQIAVVLDGSNRPVERRLYGTSVDQLLAVESIDPATNSPKGIAWPIADYQGSVRFLYGRDYLSASPGTEEQILSRIDYDPFGLPSRGVGNLGISSPYSITAGYTGREYDRTTHLQYNRARYYDPSTHTFVSQDPIGFASGTTNLYAYAGNSPSNATDPSGESATAVLGIGGAVVGFVAGGYSDPRGWSWSGAFSGAAKGAMIGVGVGLAIDSLGTAAPLSIALVGAGVGGLHAVGETYAGTPNATTSDYVTNTTIGALSGFVNPFGAFMSAGGAVIGGSAEYAVNGKFFGTGFQIGGIVGGLAAGSITDARKLMKLGVERPQAIAHVTAQTLTMGGLMTAAGYAGYKSTGTMEGALTWANLASMPASMVAQRLVTCFPAGTELLTPTGSKPIEDFKIGDEILTRSEEAVDAPIVVGVVGNVFVRTGVTLQLTVRGQKIRTTGEHPFWVKERGWTPAAQLAVGDELASHDNQWSTVEALAPVGQVETVYNLMVAEQHTYFVGCHEWGFSVWAHNADYGGMSKDEYAAWLRTNAERFPNNRTKPADLYEIKQTGKSNWAISAGGVEFDADGIKGSVLLDAKYVGKPARSPYIPGSDAPAFIRANTLAQEQSQFRRMAAIIQDPTTPFKSAKIITNHPDTVPYFEDLLKQHNIPGVVVVKA